jgi:hypothetical protein
MLSFFRKRNPVPEPNANTFNDRIRRFWEWFQEVAPSYYEAIDARKCDSLADPTSARIDELFPGFGWNYGPGEGGIGHSFTLTGEGVEHRQLLALHWLSQAPVIEGWTFFAARKSGPIKGHVIKIGDLKIDPKEIWVTPSLDEDDERMDLTIWHPLWSKIEKDQQWTIVFLFLDEALGEYGTQWWIGDIRLENDQLAGSFPLEELADFVAETSRQRNWKKFPPGEGHSLFTITPDEKPFPRSDLITLSTAAPRLFHDHREAEGRLKDPLEGTGADYLYVSIPKEYFQKGQEVDKRSEIEESLDEALRSNASGLCLGGGMGIRRSVVDLLIFDGQRSIAIIIAALKAFNLPEGTTIEYFALEKLAKRIQL